MNTSTPKPKREPRSVWYVWWNGSWQRCRASLAVWYVSIRETVRLCTPGHPPTEPPAK